MGLIRSFDQLPLLTPDASWTAPVELPSIRGCKRISIDTETCDPQLKELGPGTRRGGYICGWSLATDDGRKFYFPVRHEGGGNLDPGLIWRYAREELNVFDGTVVGANLIYDLDYLANEGVTLPLVKRFHDVQVAEPLLDEQKLRYSLESLAEDHLGEHKDERLLREAAAAYGAKSSSEVKGILWRMPAKFVGTYAETDADLPLRIMDKQLALLEQQDLLHLFDLESRLIPILLAMRRRGVRVNVKAAEGVRQKLVIQRAEIMRELRRQAGPQVELMAVESFAHALIERGLPVAKTAKSGQWSVTKDWLAKHQGDALVDLIQAGRRLNTIITTFIDGHIMSHSVNGRIHCQFHQLKGENGGTGARFASSMPNLQNIPSRDDELGPLIRGLFEPDEDCDWERHDQSQMEYRLQVHYARGPGAKEARQKYVNDPSTDFHNLCGQMMSIDITNKSLRGKIKTINFAKSYGALAPKLAISMGCSVEEAEQFVQLYEEKLPFTKVTFDEAQRVAGQRGYIRSLLGRYARFPFWEPASNARTKKALRKPALPRERALREYGASIVRADTYKALNNLLQFSNADYVKKTMVDIWEAGICNEIGPFLLQVHDELDYSVQRTKRAREAVAEAKRLMTVAVKLKVPVLVESITGNNWGECK